MRVRRPLTDLERRHRRMDRAVTWLFFFLAFDTILNALFGNWLMVGLVGLAAVVNGYVTWLRHKRFKEWELATQRAYDAHLDLQRLQAPHN